MEIGLKIRSTETMATSLTKGLCDVERTILKDGFDRNDFGVKTHQWLKIKSRKFQEQTIDIEQPTYDAEGDENGTETVSITERLYTTGKNFRESDHESIWKYPISEIEGFKQQFSALLDGKTEEEQMLIIFIALTKTAGDNGGGWETMSNWIPDIQPYVTVTEFTKMEK